MVVSASDQVFIKERLALAAFLTCYCSPQVSGPLSRLNSSAGLSIPIEGQSFKAGNNSIFGCNCSGWKEGAVGTLSCRNKKESDSLLQEFSTLNSVLGGFSYGEQALEPEGVVRDLHSNFSRLALAIPKFRQGRMDQANENAGLANLKKNLRRLYEMVAIGIMDSKEISQEIKNLVEVVSYTSYPISNHDSKINGTEMNLKEIMGKVDRI